MTRRRTWSPAVKAAIIKRQNGICACCDEPLGTDPRGFHFDHDKALWLGGEDTPENLRALIKRHHLNKTSREAGQRAKVARIQERDGLRKRRKNARDKALQRMLERSC